MSDIKKTITFTESVSVDDPDGNVTFKAKAGETMDLVATSANRWIRRNKAVVGKLEDEKLEPAIPATPKKPSAKKKAAPKK